LKGGFKTWKNAGKEIDIIESISVSHLATFNNPTIVDVRKASEFNSEHVKEAINAPLDYINESMKLITNEKTHYIHCASGYRSLIFISILQSRGYRNLINIIGGFVAIKDLNEFKVSDYVCPTTLL
jgi:rhodanese-related sulfurtransferase